MRPGRRAAQSGAVVSGILAAVLAALLAGEGIADARAAAAAAAAPSPTPAAGCAAPAETRPPDPRCGESLDGRTAWRPDGDRGLARGLLTAPRLVSRAVFWPVVKTSDVVEYHHLPSWLTVLTTSDDGLVGLRPELQYASGFVPTIGFSFFYRRLPGPSALLARFRTAGPAALFAEVGARSSQDLGLHWRATWQRRRDFLFAGLGSHTDDDLDRLGRPPARYAADRLQTEAGWTLPLPAPFSALLRADLGRRDYATEPVRGGPSVKEAYTLPAERCLALGQPPGCLDPVQLPRFREGARLLRLSTDLGVDLLGPGRDASGLRLRASGLYGEGIAGDPSRYFGLGAEAVAAGGGDDRALLLRLRADLVEAIASAPVPFEELVSPSGADGVRGFAEGRFRDRSGLVGSLEYRWYIAWNLDASLFADLGTVTGRWFAGLNPDHFFASFGVGLRLVAPGSRYWLAPATTGVQLTYAPSGGFRLILALAMF